MLFVMDSRAGEARSVPWWLFSGNSLSVLTTIFPRPTKESSQVLISFWSRSWLRHCQTVIETTHGNTQNHNSPYPMWVCKLRNVWGYDFALCFDWVRVRKVNLSKIYEKRRKTHAGLPRLFTLAHGIFVSSSDLVQDSNSLPSWLYMKRCGRHVYRPSSSPCIHSRQVCNVFWFVWWLSCAWSPGFAMMSRWYITLITVIM